MVNAMISLFFFLGCNHLKDFKTFNLFFFFLYFYEIFL